MLSSGFTLIFFQSSLFLAFLSVPPLDKLRHTACVFGSVVLVGKGVFAAFRHPKFLGLRLGFIQGIHHFRRHEGVVAAVYEQHWFAALGYLTQRRGFVEAPSVLHLAQKACRVEQGEVG